MRQRGISPLVAVPGYAIIVWDDKAGSVERAHIRYSTLCTCMACVFLAMVPCISIFSAFSTNKKRVEDGKHIVGNIIHDLVVGTQQNDNAVLGQSIGGLRLLNAQADAHVAMQALSAQQGYVVV
jgi:hypothetical protein